MREDVIRQIITRIMTDPAFADQVRTLPGKALGGLGLDREEMDALFNQINASGLDVLETRVSASLIKGTMAGTEGCKCACRPAGLPPATCDKMGC
jgi:hypothetical protein